MRVYEELFILKPDTVEEEVDGFVEQIQHVITNGKGTIDKTDKWGVRKLAYRVQKYNEGFYVLIQFTLHAGPGEGSGTPYAGSRLGDQVHHRAHRRKAEEDCQAQEGSRQARRAQAGSGAHGCPRFRQQRLRLCRRSGPRPERRHPGDARRHPQQRAESTEGKE